MSNRLSVGIVLAAGLLGSVATFAGPEQASPVYRTIWVTATDDQGRRVAELSPADLSIREAGRPRVVESVGPSADKLQLAVAVDELLAPSVAVRQAVVQLVRRLHPAGEVALYLMGRTNELRAPYGSDLSRYLGEVQAFPSKALYPGAVVQSVLQIARDQRVREGRRVIVVLAPEIPQRSNVTAEGAFEQLRDGRVTMYAATFVGWNTRTSGLVQLPPTRLEGQDLTEEVDRDRVLGDGPKQTGGLRVPVSTTEGFPAALEQIAGDLEGQFRVTYALPAGTKSDGRVSVSAARRGLRVRGPSRLPEM